MDAYPLCVCLTVVVAPLLGQTGCADSDTGRDRTNADGAAGFAGSLGGSAAGGAGGNGGAGGSLSCPAKADSCPPGCEYVKGQPIDYDACSLGKYTQLGCYLGTGGNLAMVGCIRDAATGTAYQLPTVSHEALAQSDEWTKCPSDWYASIVNCTGGNGGNGGTVTGCPPKATTCPAGCELISGQPIDYVQNCLGPYQPLGCWQGTGGNDAAWGCIQDADTGTHYRLPSTSYVGSLVQSGEWASCPPGWTSAWQNCP